MVVQHFLQLLVWCGFLVHAQSPFPLGYIPLAVKSPYLHAWIRSNGGTSPAGVWPNFVSNNREFGWGGMIRVDEQGYWWLGGGSAMTRTVTSEITPTKSIFRLEAGPIQFNVTFLSPIEPSDYVRQSMPFSYMYIDGIAANDSQTHSVQVYSDISAQWITKEDTTLVEWNTIETNDMIYHRALRQNPAPMVENGGISEDATVYYATTKRTGLTWQTGAASDLRTPFATNGSLQNSSDTKFRQVSNGWPVFGFSVDLGGVSPGDQLDPIVWSLGLVRDPLVTYITEQVPQNRSAYYWSNYLDIEQVVLDRLYDFSGALDRSLAIDNKIYSAALTISTEYAGILSLVLRQIFASMDITIPSSQAGQLNNTDVKIFMKDIGVSLRTNPVEGIFGALPALIFFNPSLARDLLQPLFEFQSSSRYPNFYAAPDLGASYPRIQGNATDTQTLAVESCGNMLIMAYAQVAKSGDTSLVSRYYPILQHWADFLIENSLHPREFITADGISGRDMSNLALKGILGVYSMAKISEVVRTPNATYMARATQLIENWKQLAISTDNHLQAVYGEANSWGLMYNLFPAVWLKMGLIENTVLEHQAQSYTQRNSQKFGFNLDSSREDVAYPHWTLMTAATIPNNSIAIRDRLIESTFQRAHMLNNNSPLPAAYKPSNGDAILGSGSPILGAAFAVAALSIQNVDSITTQITSPGSRKNNIVSTIIGGILGGFSILLLVVTVIYFIWRRRQYRHNILPKEYGVDPSVHTGDDNTNSIVPQIHSTGPRNKLTLGMGFHSASFSVEAIATPPLVMPRKQRKAFPPRGRRIDTQSESVAPSSSDPSSTSVSIPENLRAEVERLKREMELVRLTAEAPPRYT